MQQEDGVINVTGSVAMNGSQSKVMQLELGQRFTGAEAEVGKNGGSVYGGPGGGRRGVCGERSVRGGRTRLAEGCEAKEKGGCNQNPGCAKEHSWTPGGGRSDTIQPSLFSGGGV